MTDEALQRIADDLGEPIEIVREMNDAIECCADEGNLEARSERQQRAREAYHDATDLPEKFSERGLDDAIETATRVRVDDDIAAAFKQYGHPLPLEPNIIPALIAAFRAAGFEVEQ